MGDSRGRLLLAEALDALGRHGCVIVCGVLVLVVKGFATGKCLDFSVEWIDDGWTTIFAVGVGFAENFEKGFVP